MVTAYLCIGSNLGDRKQNLAQALDLLSQHLVIKQLSSIYETEPVGHQEQPLFLNAVCRVSAGLSPENLLRLAKRIETKLGRKPGPPNAPRPVDIDILFYNNEILNDKDLTIPHPRLVERAFVLVPLAEIAPDLIHPGNKKAVKKMLDALGTVTGVSKWAEADEIMIRRQDVSGLCRKPF